MSQWNVQRVAVGMCRSPLRWWLHYSASVHRHVCTRVCYSTQLSSVSECTPCSAGRYCAGVGASDTTAPCFAGFYCPGGAYNGFGATASTPSGFPCIQGHYCLNGTAAPTPCPVGRFSNVPGNAQLAHCDLCSAGRFCEGSGLTATSGPCRSGFYCQRGCTSPTPVTGVTSMLVNTSLGAEVLSVGGDVCPAGHVCGNGTVIPQPCPAGTFNPTTGEAVACSVCPAGYYCLQGAVDYVAYVRLRALVTPLCVIGRACVVGAAPRALPRTTAPTARALRTSSRARLARSLIDWACGR